MPRLPGLVSAALLSACNAPPTPTLCEASKAPADYRDGKVVGRAFIFSAEPHGMFVVADCGGRDAVLAIDTIVDRTLDERLSRLLMDGRVASVSQGHAVQGTLTGVLIGDRGFRIDKMDDLHLVRVTRTSSSLVRGLSGYTEAGRKGDRRP